MAPIVLGQIISPIHGINNNFNRVTISTYIYFLSRELIARLFSKREFGASRQGRMSSSFKETMDPVVAQSALLKAYAQANGDHGSRHGKKLISIYLRIFGYQRDMI